MKLSDDVKKVLKNNLWDLATCADGHPNVVPVAFKDVMDDGKLVVGDVFLQKTLENLAANDGRIAISVYDAKSLEGYQIQMFHGAATAKGALIITPETVIVTTPGKDNKKVLD